MLSTKKLLYKVIETFGVDYVVAQGQLSNGCKYRKWKSGKAEAWYHTSDESGMTTAVWTAPLYFGDSSSWTNVWSGVFDSAPDVMVASNNSQFISVYPISVTTNGISSLRFISVGAKSNVAYAFTLYAVGTWS